MDNGSFALEFQNHEFRQEQLAMEKQSWRQRLYHSYGKS